jgi:hypothetical protein
MSLSSRGSTPWPTLAVLDAFTATTDQQQKRPDNHATGWADHNSETIDTWAYFPKSQAFSGPMFSVLHHNAEVDPFLGRRLLWRKM